VARSFVSSYAGIGLTGHVFGRNLRDYLTVKSHGSLDEINRLKVIDIPLVCTGELAYRVM
jgi:hypothetical protein